MIRVLIADDHHVVRRGLLFFLKTQKDIEVVGEASNGEEAVQLAKALQPGEYKNICEYLQISKRVIC